MLSLYRKKLGKECRIPHICTIYIYIYNHAQTLIIYTYNAYGIYTIYTHIIYIYIYFKITHKSSKKIYILLLIYNELKANKGKLQAILKI